MDFKPPVSLGQVMISIEQLVQSIYRDM